MPNDMDRRIAAHTTLVLSKLLAAMKGKPISNTQTSAGKKISSLVAFILFNKAYLRLTQITNTQRR
jgi:hypothetical protein